MTKGQTTAARLRLQAFGCLGSREVPLSLSTIVLGGNGTGKTTFADAVQAAVLGGSSQAGGALADRLGPQARAQLVAEDGGVVSLAASAASAAHAEQIVNVLHIGRPDRGAFDGRACGDETGDGLLRQTSTRGGDAFRAAMERAAGGIAERRARLRGASRDGAARKLEDLRGRTDAALRERRRLLGVERELGELRRTVAAARADHQRCEAAIPELDKQLADERRRQALLRRAVQRQSELEALMQHRAEASELAALAPYTQGLANEIAELEAEVRTYQRHIEGIEQRRASSQDRLQAAVAQIETARAKRETMRSLAARAMALKLRIERALQVPAVRRGKATSRGRRLGAAALMGGMSSAWLWPAFRVLLGADTSGSGESAASLATVTASATAAAALMGFGWLGGRSPDVDDQAAYLGELGAEWNRDVPPEYAMDNFAASAMVAVCQRAIDDYERLQRQLDEQIGYKCRVEEELAEVLERSKKMLEHSLSSRIQARDAWLQAHGVETCEAYLAATARRLELLAHEESRRQAFPHFFALGIDFDRLQDDLRDDLADLAKRAAGVHCMPDDAIDALDDEVTQARSLRERLQAQIEVCDNRQRILCDELRAGTERIPEVLFELERARTEVERQQQHTNVELAACDIAEGLVRQLGAQSDPRCLFNDTFDAYMQVLPLGGIVRMAGQSDGFALCVDDAHGHGRSLHVLGSGAADAARLAARLALAETAGSDVPILCLEEPFVHMDETLARACLGMLATFQNACGWQLLLISKENRLAAWAAEALQGVSVVDLG